MAISLIDRLLGRSDLSPAAKAAMQKDAQGLPETDPGIDRAVEEMVGWLLRAQENSASHDGGVARDYSLIAGWATSYPETTGYIVPTLLDCARRTGRGDVRRAARRMLDWLVSIQLPDGGCQGGKIDARPVVPVTFNTGQILLGLAAGVAEFGDAYRPAMAAAARFLRDSQDADGCWRRHPTPFAESGEKAYETHVAWGLFEADRLAPGEGYGAAGLHQVRWALTHQAENGWFEKCCLSDPKVPLTHTLGYALKGVVEAYRFSKDKEFLEVAEKTARGLMSAQRQDGALPGMLDRNWRPAAKWSCLTGNAQIAWSWLFLYKETGDAAYRDAAFRANAFVRRTIDVEGPDVIRGGVKGSFPIDGDYGRFEYLNWAAKFAIDANLLERDVRG